MARAWCKVASNLDIHPKIREAGNLGRQVYEYALRLNSELDKDGLIPGRYMEPEYLTHVLMLTDLCEMSGTSPGLSGTQCAVSGLSRAVRADLLVRDNGDFRIVGWDTEWAKHRLSESQRKAAYRAKMRNHVVSGTVPDNLGHVPRCPESPRSEERRGEEIRVSELEPKSENSLGRNRESDPPLAIARTIPAPRAPTPTSTWARRKVWWDEMLEADERIKTSGIEPNAPSLPKQCAGEHEKNIMAVAEQLEAMGFSPVEVDAKMRHIVLVAEANAIHVTKSRKFFKPSTIWKPANAMRSADTSLSEAATDNVIQLGAQNAKSVTVGRVEPKGPEHYGHGRQKI